MDVQIPTPLWTSSGSSLCIPMLLAINASLSVFTMGVAATSPWLPKPFFVSCVGSPFNTLMFLGAPSSACKRSSITLSDSPEWRAAGAH